MTIRDENRLTTADLASARPRVEERDSTIYMRPVGVHGVDGETEELLFPDDDLSELKSRWSAIQLTFVDEPRRSVEEADGLVASTIKQLAESFASERAKLESQWGKGDDVSTEDLRLALRRYRSFFNRLLAV